MELQSKITVKGCGWTKEKIQAYLLATQAVPEKTENGVKSPAVPATYHEKRDLVKVVGVVNRVKPGQTTVGDKTNDYLRLIGNFQGVNLETGEIYAAPSCILSDIVAAPIKEALDSGATEVQFAVMISAKYSATAATLYEFVTKPLLEVKPSDKMAALLALAGVETAPALQAPAPAPAADPEPAPAPEAAPSPAPTASSKKK